MWRLRQQAQSGATCPHEGGLMRGVQPPVIRCSPPARSLAPTVASLVQGGHSAQPTSKANGFVQHDLGLQASFAMPRLQSGGGSGGGGAPRQAPQQQQAASPSAVRPAGAPEVVWGHDKTAEQLRASLTALAQRQRVALALRVDELVAAEVERILPGTTYIPAAKVLTFRDESATGLPKPPRLPGTVAIVTAASGDALIAEECRVLADQMGCYAFKVSGVSLPSAARSLGSLAAADVVVVVSGMDVALPCLVSGMVDAPVIALPTSTGGAPSGLDGVAHLFASLSASAPGVTVVNLDSAYGAAATAARILRTASRLHSKRTAAAQAQAQHASSLSAMAA